MKTEDEETDLVTFADGKTCRVYKNTPPPTPPLPVTVIEEKMLDVAIRQMASRFRREGIVVDRPRFVNKEPEACAAIDKIVAEGLWGLRKNVTEDPAEKLFERLGTLSVDWGDDTLAVGVIFIRYWDTFEAMVSYKGKYRGKDRPRCKHTKEEALEILRQRGLTRR